MAHLIENSYKLKIGELSFCHVVVNKIRNRQLLLLVQCLEGVGADIGDCLSLTFRFGHKMAAQVSDKCLHSQQEGEGGVP